MSALLTRKTLIYAEQEGTYGVAPSFTDAGSPLLVEDPDFNVELNVLERNFYKQALGPSAHIIGRKLAKVRFTTEVRGSGAFGTASRLGRLFEACSMTETNKAAAYIGTPVVLDALGGPSIAWAFGGTTTIITPVTIVFEVTTGGASGVAQGKIHYDNGTADTSPAVITTTVAITLTGTGLSSATLTPTFSGTLLLGQKYVIQIRPPGKEYKPDSTVFKSVGMRVYRDGILHTVLGCYGTFTVTAEAGAYAKATFDFTGIYAGPTDVALPGSPIFETTLPSQVELGRLSIDGFGIEDGQPGAPIVQTFSYDAGVQIQPRPSINHADGNVGIRIVSRNPSGGIDPEMELVASQDFWGKLAAARRMPFTMRCGTATGNIVTFYAPNTQYTGLTYRDRNGLLVLDAGLKFADILGDDEFFIYTC